MYNIIKSLWQLAGKQYSFPGRLFLQGGSHEVKPVCGIQFSFPLKPWLTSVRPWEYTI